MPERMGPGMSVKGFVLPAKHARKGRRHQFVFLNGRPIEDAAVTKGLAEGFRGNLQEGLHPAAWLWLELEPQLVDVNVHPAKREVRFHRPFEVRDLISQTVAECLRPAPVKRPEPVREASTPLVSQPTFHPSQPELLALPAAAEAPVKRRAPDFRIIGMLQERYVIMESADGLVLFDPKAARERILFEKLSKGRKDGMETQSLLVPLLFELDPRDLDLLLRERMALLDAGIEIEAFGGNTLQVRSLPEGLPLGDPHGFIDELLEELLHGPAATARFTFDRVSKAIAMKAAQRVTPRLTEAAALLEELFHCDLPYCGADGRPTLTEYNRKDIDRRFGVGRG